MDKLLSIIVPTYNMERYLDRCLSSLILHDLSLMSKFEVLVINDGSTDRSSEIAHKYEKKYPNTFIVVDKENGNYGSCINKGLKEAKGLYFRTLDADDFYNTAAFELFICALSSIQSDLIVSEYVMNYADRKLYRLIPSSIEDLKEYNAKKFDINSNDCRKIFDIHSMTYKTSLLKDLGLNLQERISYTDTEFCYFPFRFVESIVFCRNMVYEYSLDLPNQTVSVSSRIKSLNAMSLIAFRILDDFKTLSLTENSIVCDNCRIFSRSVVEYYYQTVLLYCKKNEVLNENLKSFDEKVKNCDIVLYKILDNVRFNNIKYIKLWRMFGIYNTNFIFALINNLYSIKDSLKCLFKRK